MLKSFFVVLMSWFFCFELMAASLQEQIDTAIAAHDAGDYESAIASYESLIEDGHINGHVYYNLGNAYYRSGDMGNAAAAYLAAAKYLPRSPDVSANLNYARKGAVDKLEASVGRSWWAIPGFWSEYFSGKELAYACALSVGLGAIIWMLGWLKAPLAPGMRLTAMGAWCVAAVLLYGLGVKYGTGGTWGAVTADSASVYSGPNDQANKTLFELHEAAPVLVQQEQNDWIQIQISDGKKGWIKRSSLRVYR